MLPPLTLRSERLRDTSNETARAIAARITSEPAASDARIAMRGIGVDEDEVAAAFVAAKPVCAAFDAEPPAATTAGFVCFFGFVVACLWWCFFTGFECVVPPVGCELVVGVDVTGGGVEVVTGGGLLVLVGGGGEDVGGGGGGGGGVPATAADARASPTATAITPPKIEPMTLVALNVPLCAGGLPGRPHTRDSSCRA